MKRSIEEIDEVNKDTSTIIKVFKINQMKEYIFCNSPDEIIMYIMKSFNPDEWLKIMLTCKDGMNYMTIKLKELKSHYKESTLRLTFDKISDHLEFNGLKDSISNFCIKEKACIAGSYPLSMFFKDFKANDIDIFVPTREGLKTKTDVLSFALQYFGKECMLTLDNKAVMITEKDYKHLNGIVATVKMYRKFTENCQYGLTIQLILVDLSIITFNLNKSLTLQKEISIEDYVKQKFDLTYCMMWYDGLKLDCSKFYQTRIRIGQINERLVSTLDKLNLFEFELLQDRIEKYHDRKFKTVNSDKLVFGRDNL